MQPFTIISIISRKAWPGFLCLLRPSVRCLGGRQAGRQQTHTGFIRAAGPDRQMWEGIRSFIQSFIHSLLVSSFVPLFVFSFVRSSVRLFIHLCIRSFINSYVFHSFVHSLNYTFVYSFVHSSLKLLIRTRSLIFYSYIL